MREEHADPAAGSDGVAGVGDIHHVETRRDRVPAGNVEFMRHAGIDLRVGRNVVGIEIAGTKTTAVYHVGGEARAIPEIGDAAGSGPDLDVVGVDPVVLDVGNLVRAEEILVADDVGRPLKGPGPVRIGPQIAIGVHGLELDPGILPLRIVEPVQHQRRAELPVVQQIPGGFQISIDPHLETRPYLLHHADVIDVRPLRQHGIVRRRSPGRLEGRAGRDADGSGTAGVQIGIAGRRDHLHRRGESAGIAGVESRAVERIIGQADAWTELVGVLVLPHLIEPRAGIQCQLIRKLPFVLQIDAAQPAEEHAGIDRGKRGIGQDLRARGRVEGQQLRCACDGRLLRADVEPRAQRMRVVEVKRAVALDAVDDAATINIRCQAVVHQVADAIRRERNGAGTHEIGKLKVDVSGGFLQREHAELVCLALIFVDLR